MGRDYPDGLVRSYLFQRRGIGIIGIGTPFVLTIGYAIGTRQATLLDSLSAYYHTPMRDVFVGSLCATGVFLISYRYDWLDDLLSTLAGTLAILVALLPTATPGAGNVAVLVGWLHYGCATGLLLLFAVFCLALFPRTDPALPPTGRKRQRNRIYRACGTIILISLVIAAYGRTPLAPSWLDGHTPALLACESVAVFAFGISWLIKGQTLLKDAPTPTTPSPTVIEAADPVPTLHHRSPIDHFHLVRAPGSGELP